MFPNTTRILICDDMMTMRKVVKKVLGELGFTDVAEAPDGAAGWETITKALGEGKPFGLVVSDWNMPNMLGIDLLRKVRSTDTTKTLPFVLVTAEGEASQIKEALGAGVDAYVIKPFTGVTLGEKLTAVWKKYHP